MRGLNAPPRITFAPWAVTKSTVSISWSRLSTEHGPAMTVREPSPIAVSRTRMTVFSGWNSRETSLYGLEIGVTVATPGVASRRERSCSRRRPSSPTTAITVRAAPAFSNGVSPSARIRPFTPLTSASVASARITTNISSGILCEGGTSRGEQKSRGQKPLLTRHDPPYPGLQTPESVMPGR